LDETFSERWEYLITHDTCHGIALYIFWDSMQQPPRLTPWRIQILLDSPGKKASLPVVFVHSDLKFNPAVPLASPISTVWGNRHHFSIPNPSDSMSVHSQIHQGMCHSLCPLFRKGLIIPDVPCTVRMACHHNFRFRISL
jgi:hypothetical protein